MRLLNVFTFEFAIFVEDAPDYVIVSHRWSAEEITCQDILYKHNWRRRGYEKVRKLCAFIVNNHRLFPVDWIWIDTCCIDKTSSSELTEAINSMFQWYARAYLCLALLEDVSSLQGLELANSVWFTRGWTLQELLAPSCVVFLSNTWHILGSKMGSCFLQTPARLVGLGAALNESIAAITGIPVEVLYNYEVGGACLSIEHKLSWMQNRTTTRIEDRAYCLLGLVNVNMPLIYGEGEKAMTRLMNKIRKHSGSSDRRQHSSPARTLSSGSDGITPTLVLSPRNSFPHEMTISDPPTMGTKWRTLGQELSQSMSTLAQIECVEAQTAIRPVSHDRERAQGSCTNCHGRGTTNDSLDPRSGTSSHSGTRKSRRRMTTSMSTMPRRPAIRQHAGSSRPGLQSRSRIISRRADRRTKDNTTAGDSANDVRETTRRWLRNENPRISKDRSARNL